MAEAPGNGGRLVVVGEAILDLVAQAADDGVFERATGGSSYNTALALGRLGMAAEFAGALSLDGAGEQFAQKLVQANVGLTWCVRSKLPMPIALAQPDPATGSVRFTLYLEGTAHQETDALPPRLPADVQHLHAASFRCLLGAQGAAALAAMQQAREQASVSFDPNIRPSLMPPRAETVALVEARVRAATLVKASDEDMTWLYPDTALEAVAQNWLKLGAELIVVTRGAHGAFAAWRDGMATSAAKKIELIDAIGAGDSFSAGLLAALAREGRLGGAARLQPDRDSVSRWLDYASRIAAFTCSRRGADPPWSHEL